MFCRKGDLISLGPITIISLSTFLSPKGSIGIASTYRRRTEVSRYLLLQNVEIHDEKLSELGEVIPHTSPPKLHFFKVIICLNINAQL